MLDQIAHYILGYMMARSLRGLLPRREIIARVLMWAEEREDLQHPGRCNSGCQRDLYWWRKGAEKGAGSK